MLSVLLQARTNAQSPDEYRRLQTHCTRRLKKPAPDAAAPLLYRSTRAWAQAMALHTETRFSRKSSAAQRTAHRIASRLAKSEKYATAAAEHDASALVFAHLAAADRHVVRQQWHAAVRPLCAARVALAERQAEAAVSDFIASKLDPLLKLALARDGRARGADLAVLAAQEVGAPLPEREQGTPQITFCGFTVDVAWDELRRALARAESASRGLDAESPDFDAALALWARASDVCADLQADSDESQDLAVVASYVQFQLLVARVRRDVHGVAALPAEQRTRIYHLILQTCAALLELPGVHSQDALVAALGAMQNYFGAMELRCFGATQTDPIARLACAREAYERARASAAAPEFGLPVSAADVATLRAEADRELVATYGVAALFDYARTASAARSSLASNTAAYNFGLPVADLEVRELDLVPLKPVFYDLAYSFTQE